MTARISHWIDGKLWQEAAERTGDVYDPATGQVAALVDFAGPSELDEAVAAARAAAPNWGNASLATRTRVLFEFRRLLFDNRHRLAEIVTAEHGKVLEDALGEVSRAMEAVDFACGAPAMLKGGFSENVSSGVDVHSIRQPLGVVGVISPFNFPAMVPLWFLPNALVCGNAVVLKPSEKDPSAANFLAELWRDAGLPDGVLNVLHGDRTAVDGLLAHPDVRAISFVGSTPVARHIYETGTAHGKRVQALGGAKNHMVVLPDADLDQAADAAVSAGFGSAGERCMAVSVVVAVDPVGDELVDRIVARAERLRLGDGRRPGCDMGPLVTGAHRDRVLSYVDAGVSAGATLAIDGRGHEVDGEPSGFWLGPTVFDHVQPEMSVYTDEIFGPVLSVVRAPTYADAVHLVDSNPYGNGTAIFTSDGGAARRFQHEVDTGMVGVNVPIPVPVGYYSFGGWKSSLFGDTHAYGPDGLHFFTRTKVVTSRWPQRPVGTPHPGGAQGGVDLHFPRNA